MAPCIVDAERVDIDCSSDLATQWRPISLSEQTQDARAFSNEMEFCIRRHVSQAVIPCSLISDLHKSSDPPWHGAFASNTRREYVT